MKRFMFITVLLSVSILATWAFFEVFAASPRDTKSDNAPSKVQEATDGLLKANQSADAPVPAAGVDVKIAPVFDSTGALVSDPNGTLVNANESDVKVIPVTKCGRKGCNRVR